MVVRGGPGGVGCDGGRYEACDGGGGNAGVGAAEVTGGAVVRCGEGGVGVRRNGGEVVRGGAGGVGRASTVGEARVGGGRDGDEMTGGEGGIGMTGVDV